MCKVWQKVDDGADFFPRFKYAKITNLVDPPMQLEDSRGRREGGGENAERCIHNA